MRKALIAILITTCTVALIFVIIIRFVWIQPDKNPELNTISYQNSELILLATNLIITSVLSYFLYKVNHKLTDVTVKQHDSKIKEASYQIFYCLNYNIGSLLKQIKHGEPINIDFKMHGDYIKYTANLSSRLPDELIHELYEIFFDLAYISSDNEENKKENVLKLFKKIFVEDVIVYVNKNNERASLLESVSLQGYHDNFNTKFSLIYNEISEIINISK